ncbi:MAG: hypothetical protein WCB15_08485 [Desulfobacterales bacterium]
MMAENSRKTVVCSWNEWDPLKHVIVGRASGTMIQAAETPMMKLFDKYGFEVIPVPLFEVSPFGGGLHCATADVCREGSLEDYFPRQIDGF